MTNAELQRVREWFTSYAAGFLDEPDTGDRRNIELKIRHTGHVAEDVVIIAREEGLPEPDVALAGAAGVLHDTGRFPQYREYRTFKDRESVNHGELGAEVVKSEGILGTGEDARLVLTAIKYHNAHSTPHLGDERAEMFIRLVRDADKIDIWRVMLEEFFECPPEYRASAAGLSLPESPRATPELVSTLAAGRLVTLAMLRSQMDFILMLVSWCNDLNFATTALMLLKRGYFERYLALLAGDPEAARAVEGVREMLKGRFT